MFPAGLAGVLVAAAATASLGFSLAPGADDRSLDEIRKDLEITPNDPGLLMEAADAAFADADDDQAIWYAELARMLAGEGKEAKAIDKRLKTLRGEIGVELPPVGTAVDAHAKDIFQFAKLCQSGKLYANSADILTSLRGTPYADSAESRLEKMFKSKKAVGAMLESGVPVKVSTRKKRSAKETKRLNEKHSDWENAYEAKGKYYTVKTNMGVDMAEAILGAMEQMNGFYRKVFDYKASGGSMRRCEVRVYKTRAEFDAATGVEPNVGGFYMPSENSVTTYDPRTAEGFMQGPIDELWSTLYHEASHQFTRMVWKILIPTWLNEGTASYFEGAALLPGGFVETNRIPPSRLRSVVMQIGGKNPADPASLDELDPSPDAVKLWDVITYFQPGSYPGTHYSFGWSLVYFCMNYENDDSERIYTPIYQGFMRSYTSGSGEKNPGKRFKQYFIEEAEIPGVESYDDFERRWKEWVLALSRIEFGGPEQADVLIERAKKQLGNDKTEYAIDSLRWALRKRPDDPLALRMLGQALEEVRNKDAALFSYRRLVTVARGARDASAPLPHYDGTAEEALAAGLEGIKSINRSLGDMLEKQYDDFVVNALAEADAWAEAEYPRVALQVLKMSNDVVGGEGRLLARAAEIQDEAEVDVRRTRRLTVTRELDDWEQSGKGWFAIDDTDGTTGLRRGTDGYAEATYQVEPPETFLFEVDVVVEEMDDFPVVGVTFAGGLAGNKVYVRLGKTGRAGLLQFDPETGMPSFDAQFKSKSKMKAGEPFTMGIEVGRTATRFLIDGEEVGKTEGSASASAGLLGVMTQGTEAQFLNPRITY